MIVPRFLRLTLKRIAARRAMTLVELLVTLALSALVLATVIATLVGGFRVWERLQGQGRQSQWVHVAFDQIRRDLHNVRRFQRIPFEGAYEEFSFPAMVSSEGAEGERVAELGAVRYYLDATHQRLCRSQTLYRHLRHARARETCAAVLQGVERLRVAYYRADFENQTFRWVERWSAPEVPLAVKIQISYHDASTTQMVAQTLIVALPLASPSGVPTP